MQLSTKTFNACLKLYLLEILSLKPLALSEIEKFTIGKAPSIFRPTLKKFIKLEILNKIENGNDRFDKYVVNKEKLLEYLKMSDEFKKIYIIIRDELTIFHPDMYELEELKRMEFEIKKVSEKENNAKQRIQTN